MPCAARLHNHIVPWDACLQGVHDALAIGSSGSRRQAALLDLAQLALQAAHRPQQLRLIHAVPCNKCEGLALACLY